MIVPTVSVIALAGNLYEAYDALKIAGRAAAAENGVVLATALHFIHSRLAAMEEILLAIIEEQSPKGEVHGST